MFRLMEKQLHILIGGLCGATILLFCFLGVLYRPDTSKMGELTELSDYSEGWVATYQPSDQDVLKAFQQTEDADSVPKGQIRKVTNLPDSFITEKGNTVTLTHKVPDMNLDTRYLVLETDGEQISVSVDGQMIYESVKSEASLSVLHVIPLEVKYRDGYLTIQITSVVRNEISLDGICEGDYSQVLASAWKENGSYIIMGEVLVICSICFFMVWLFARNKIRNKRPLLYNAAEMLTLGIVFLSESSLMKIWLQWTYGIYFIETSAIVILLVLHLMMIRSFTYKKKLLSLLDMGMLGCCIYYISIMVLQGFSLVQFDTIRLFSIGLAGVVFFIYTIILGISVLIYKRKEEKPVFLANSVLLLGALLQIFHMVMNGQKALETGYIIAGILLYYIILMTTSLMLAVRMEQTEHSDEDIEVQSRLQVIEELNPNLLFASFHTMQKLIKSGSTNSAKMLYYISVYFRDNLKAMKEPFEKIPFEEELEHILAYLTLQKTRNTQLDFSVECKVRNFEVPRRSLEPMIENAVVYGIAGKDNQGNVVIRTYEREEGYAIQIIDDGIGFDAGQLRKTNATSLKVILEQLEHRCKARTEVVSRPGKGTVITMILPIPDEDMEEE